ncbi:hypothetical protein DQ04_07741010 [Trypanosoma grayi]|uniref:hypothetical protein n=1 Tax=Trypanosoma grayi TaxID=71804 RepID=UPI0004F4BCB3|nr:hypothetical protein DQ04_07741010 [Trypanosoma grayi]KEG08205.1 hypothetical protein DQ04_07741010 [Trypanosoma grayi]
MSGFKEGSAASGAQQLSDRKATRQKTLVNKEKIQQLESFISVSCAQHVPEPQRGTNVRKVLDELSCIQPSLSGIVLMVRRYLKELSASGESVQESHRMEIKNLEQNIYKKYESFFEEKILQLIRDKRKSESTCKQLRDEILMLRKERDEELMKAKETVMLRLNECQRKEDEFSSFRKLIASVFKTNESLVNRVEDLETLLRKHRIEVPRAGEDLYTYSKPKSEDTSKRREEDGVRKIQSQVSLSFMEASREEMNLARLSLQRELLNSAFDDRTAYRIQVNGLKNDNSSLRTQIEILQDQVLDLEKYIHEKRFVSALGEGGEVPLTPRPRDVSFAVQTDLGIDLKNSTAQVVAELAAVGTNLKHQLNSAVMALRQLTSAVEWMEEETVLKVAEHSNVLGVLPTFATSLWDSIPHFLRTHVEPSVPNLRWTETETATLVFDFFSNYSHLKTACRADRDSKMIAPRVYQLFERSSHPLVRLDATASEMQQSENNIPFGYVVSYFISKILKTATSECPHSKLLQSGTLNPAFLHNGISDPVEMEFGKFSYNLWYSTHRYKEQQPLCRLFVDVVDGRLPVQLFDTMQRVLLFVETRIRKFDSDGSNSFTYNKLVSSVLKLVADMDAHVGRCVTLSVMETFKTNQIPLVGGRIFLPAILADETCVERSDVPRSSRHRSIVGMRMSRKSNISEQPQGASVLTRFWRRLIIQRHERVYNLLERVLGPLVVESQVVIGVFLLPVPVALEAVKEFDENRLNLTAEYLAERYPSLPEHDIKIPGESLRESEAPAAPTFTEKYSNVLGERRFSLREFKDISLEQLLVTALEGVQRFSRSVHFPVAAQHRAVPSLGAPLPDAVDPPKDAQTENESPQIKNTNNKKATKQKSKGKKKLGASRSVERKRKTPSPPPPEDAIPTQMTVNSDKEMVEWYGLCLAIRQSTLTLPESIFVDEKVSHPEKTPLVSALVSLPRLEAEESWPCRSS